MTFTQPCNTSTVNSVLSSRSVKSAQRKVDSGCIPDVPYIFRNIDVIRPGKGNQLTQEKKIQVLACLPEEGEITLGSNRNPGLRPVDVVLRHATHEGEPIGISHHACTIKRIDNVANSEACFWIKGSKTQERCDQVGNGIGTKLFGSLDWFGGPEKEGEYIQRVDKESRPFSAVAIKDSCTTCIQVLHGREVKDQIFLSIPPDWNPQFNDCEYKATAHHWYWVPPSSNLDDVPMPMPPPDEQVSASNADIPPTQESLQSLRQGETRHLSKGNYRNRLGQNPVKIFHQILSKLDFSHDDVTQAPSQGADTDIFKLMDLPPLSASRDPVVRERGTIFECAAKYLSLEVTQAYKYQPGKYATGNLFRQRWMNSSSCIPLDDLRELIESGQSSERGCDSAYFAGDPTMTSKDARDLALCLAPYYENEFAALLGSKKEYGAELNKLRNDKNYISSILVTVLARALLTPIILYLPDGGRKPIYFYPYPIMEGGKALPQFGDYSRPPMRLSLWSNGEYSLLMPIGYDEKYLDQSPSPLLGDNGKGVGAESMLNKRAKPNQGKRQPVQCRFYHLFEKTKGKHYVVNKGKPVKQPGLTLYCGSDAKIADEARKLMNPLLELLKVHFPQKDGIVYELSDIEEFAGPRGYLKYRHYRKGGGFKTLDPLYYLRYNQSPPKDHLALKKENRHMMLNNDSKQPAMAYNTVLTYRNISISYVDELAKSKKLRDEIKRCSLSGFFGVHIKRFPTMQTALRMIDTYHATAAIPSNGQFLPLDLQYIGCIPVANGPYAGDSNSGDQISGKVWLEHLPKYLREQVEGFHLKYCIMPAWMLPESALIAVPRHLEWEDLHSSWVYVGSSAVGSLYFHRYKRGRSEYIELQRHAIANVPVQLSDDLNFTCVGDNTKGCEQLAKSSVPIPLTKVAEATFTDESTFVVESGCEVKIVIADGEYCKPDSVTINDKDKMERHNEMVEQLLAELKGKAKGSSKSAKKQPAKAKKQASNSKEQSKSAGEKRGASSLSTKKSAKKIDSSNDDFSEEVTPKPKKGAPAKKPAKRKGRKDGSDDDDDFQPTGKQSSKVPARATASRARSTDKKPKYNYDDDDDDDEIDSSDDDNSEEVPPKKRVKKDAKSKKKKHR